MKTAGLIFLLLAAVSISAQTHKGHHQQPTKEADVSGPANLSTFCCRHPVRIFGDQTTVNLKPLFHWWGKHDDSTNQVADPTRPLTSWHRITGIKVGDLEYSWVVNAVIYTSPNTRANARIILKNPPVMEEKNFYDLKARIAQIDLQATNSQRAYQNHLKAAQKAESRAQADKNTRNRRTRTKNSENTRLAAQENADAQADLNDQKQLEQARAQAEKQLQLIPSANSRYQIDWFALEVGRNQQGVLIYDLGVVDLNSP
jgi:hypothetical protein